MKRLLAYLFVVIGLVLTFNVSANAKIVFCELLIKDDGGQILKAGQRGAYGATYDVEPVYFAKDKCYCIGDGGGCKKYHPQISLENYVDKILAYKIRIGKSSLSNYFVPLNVGRSLIKEFEKNKINTSYLLSVLESRYRVEKKDLPGVNQNQITKVEPSQTQKVVKSGDWRSNMQIESTKTDNSSITARAFPKTDWNEWKKEQGFAPKKKVKVTKREISKSQTENSSRASRVFPKTNWDEWNKEQGFTKKIINSKKLNKKNISLIEADDSEIKLFVPYGSSGSTKIANDWCKEYNKISKFKGGTYKSSLGGRIGTIQIYSCEDDQNQTQIAKAETTIKPKKKVKVAKVEEPKQEEFKPENKDIDNDAPVIEIAQNIIVDSQTYTLKGKVKDKSRFQLTIDERPIKVAKNGQFEFEGFAIDSKEQLKIVAIDRWKNKSEKVINVEVKIKQVADLRSYEKPNPSKIKVKKDNNKIGIIIGIEKYQNLNNIDAPYANRDAKAFKAYANIALGIPNNNLKVLIDEDATRGELLKSLKIWLPQITRGKEKDIYIFFAGHGLASDNGEDLHILPHNGDPILLEDTALSRIEMFDLINKVNPKSVTMFFDTCYSGQTRSEQMLIAGLRPVRIVADEQDTPNNFTIFTASNYDQTSGSINEAEHGIFSYYLMKGLEGKADENSDKKITNGELISYLKNNVTQEAFSQNRSQEPMLSGDPNKVLISYR